MTFVKNGIMEGKRPEIVTIKNNDLNTVTRLCFVKLNINTRKHRFWFLFCKKFSSNLIIFFLILFPLNFLYENNNYDIALQRQVLLILT